MAQNPLIKQLCEQSDFESLFWDDESSHLLRLLRLQKGKSAEKHIEMLKVTQETEKEFFWQEAAMSNLLAFLYLINGEDELALTQLNLTLEHDPNNLNAIVGMTRILGDQFQASEAKKKIDHYRKLKEDSKEMEKQKNICQGEIAYACSFIGPDFYIQAIDRYVALLGQVDQTVTDELNGFIIRWQYYLAYTYNRMLNKGHKEKLANKLGTNDTREIFRKIYELYDKVISSDDEFHKGKAMIDLVDTYKKCETSGNHQNIQFPFGCGPDVFVKRAMDTAPSDPHVVERCGRHYRQRACNKKEFEETVAIFDRLLKLHPTRHVAWHHKGLACRALWHIVGKYREANLYSNNARKGDKKCVQRQLRQVPHVDDASAAPAELQRKNCSPASLPHQDVCMPLSVQFENVSAEQTTNKLEIYSDSRKAPQSAPRQLPTLRPWNRQQLGDVPRQPKKPDYFDKLRTNNPPVKKNRSRTFLEQARECFEKAKTITKGTSSPYIVDLARSLISLGLCDEAEREFTAANKLANTMNNNDATYLYEQWALFRHGRAKEEETPDEKRSKMNDTARLYRQAILSAVRAREKSRMAFYNLRDLLGDELQHDTDNPALEVEYSVLHNSVEKYSECKEILVKALEEDEDTRNNAWHMIGLLHSRKHTHDAATAFMYLTALHEAKQLNLLDDSAAASYGHESNKQLLLDVVWQLVRDGDETNANSGQTFGEIFRWMVGTGHISDYMTPDRNSPRPFADSGEICILAPRDTTPGVETVLRVLRDVCSIAVVRALGQGYDDIPPGSSILEGLRAVVAIAQAVVVVEDSTDENWNLLFCILEELMTKKEVKVCFAADTDTDCSNTEPRYVERWGPRVIIRRNCDIQLAYELLKAMFCNELIEL